MVMSEIWVIIGGLLGTLIIVLGGLIVWQWRRDASRAKDDKDLEALRIVYGFWLIVYALLIALLVLVVTLIALSSDTKTTDIVAIIGTVTGLITTLTAAFFGIQQAGAGRSQAMTALSDQVKAQGPDGAAAYKLEPSYGPHAGGTRVSISGNGFTRANAVNFGETPGTNFEFVNDGLVRANSPPAPDGVNEAKVSVVFPGATPVNREVGTFYYYTINPSHGPANVETPVTIRGSGLQAANAVMFGEKPGTALTRKPPDSLEVKAPSADKAGDVDVKVLFPVDSPTNSFVVGKYHYE
jgi:uncharacterized Tic20 family protein